MISLHCISPNSQRNPKPCASRGFTLIELLVVIAIVAILASILFPVFAKVREKGRQTACGQHMRQITTAFLMYADDHDGTLPGLQAFRQSAQIYGQVAFGDFNTGALARYLTTKAILMCPSISKRDLQQFQQEFRQPLLFSYSVNGYTTYAGCGGLPGEYTGNRERAEVQGMKLSAFPNPSGTIHLVDEHVGRAMDEIPDGANMVNNELFFHDDRATNRHGNKANVTYLDGHVGQIPGAAQWRTGVWPDGRYIFHAEPICY